jgi:hypothetical protein
MTEAEVLRRVEEIRSIASDDSTAHLEEDNLREEVLQAIADGVCDNPQACARAALTTEDIDFARYHS